MPAQLADPGVFETIPQRTRIARSGPTWLRLDAEPQPASWDREPTSQPVPVIDQRADVIRIVTNDDHARIAMWIRHEDAMPVVARETQIAGTRGAGVWLHPGVPLELLQMKRGQRGVRVSTERVEATGWIDTTAIGTVWTFAPPPVFTATATLVGNTSIRSAPDPSAAMLATTRDGVGVTWEAAGDGWRAIVLEHEGIRVRGFVEASFVFEKPPEEWELDWTRLDLHDLPHAADRRAAWDVSVRPRERRCRRRPDHREAAPRSSRRRGVARRLRRNTLGYAHRVSPPHGSRPGVVSALTRAVAIEIQPTEPREPLSLLRRPTHRRPDRRWRTTVPNAGCSGSWDA